MVVGFHVLPSPAGPKQTSTSRTVADHIAVYHVAQVVVGRSPTGIPSADTTDEPGRKPQTEGRQPVRVGYATKRDTKNDTYTGVRRVT